MAPVITKRKNIQFALAKVYEDQPFTEAKVAEPKLDGLRGAIIIEQDNICGALTRTGLPIPNAQLIVAELIHSNIFNGFVLDGEFMGKDWNESQSIVKTQSLHPDRGNLRFHVFDILRLSEWNAQHSCVPLHQRRRDLERMVRSAALTRTVLVPQVVVANQPAARNEFHRQLSKGYEGIMLKDPQAPYAFKKSSAWLKYKPVSEGDFTVVGVVEGRGKHEGVLGALKIMGTVEWKGREVNVTSEVGTGFDDITRRKLWDDHHLNATYGGTLTGLFGRTVEVEFQEVTEDNALRFPSFRRMRDDKAA